jgi:hypothetical protein
MAEKEDHIAAHQSSIYHETEVMKSETCGCFYCLEIFAPAAIEDWTDENSEDIERTALCPKCGIDAVIGSASGFPVTKEFLRKMRDHWF